MKEKILLGYRRHDYTRSNGMQVKGYEIYFAEKVDKNEDGAGAYPYLRWRQETKSFQNWYVTEERFNKLSGIEKLIGKPVIFYLDPEYHMICSIIPG